MKSGGRHHAGFSFVVNTPTYIVLFAFLLPMPSGASKNLPKSDLRHFRTLYLSLVTAGSNPEAVKRGITKMLPLLTVDPRVKIALITDEPKDKLFANLSSSITLVTTPISYTPAHAKYKARALEYFRTSSKLASSDWVLHLDEETVIDAHTVRACIQFIQEEKQYHLGQGIILYNAHRFWEARLPTIADIPRARDDYGKFFIGPRWVHSPFLGLHGSFLLISGEVQNAIGWDTRSEAEDMWLGIEAWKKNYKIGWIPSIVREQSPNNIVESWRQRSRWFGGMPKAKGLQARLNMTLWILETCGGPILIVSWRHLTLPFWMYYFLIVTNVTDFWSMIYACLVQDVDSQLGLPTILFHAIFYAPFALICKWIEGLVILYTILRPPKGFYVVSK
ncbi:hypothetical protein V496_02228 [Pseudogymnoascus sp. VKM F-4515 (FW-2607)]|nr:hypothetical protein V496_02228 [Pseudogymnoascus sp. VKM F-4515 (FW-2607)]